MKTAILTAPRSKSKTLQRRLQAFLLAALLLPLCAGPAAAENGETEPETAAAAQQAEIESPLPITPTPPQAEPPQEAQARVVTEPPLSAAIQATARDTLNEVKKLSTTVQDMFNASQARSDSISENIKTIESRISQLAEASAQRDPLLMVTLVLAALALLAAAAAAFTGYKNKGGVSRVVASPARGLNADEVQAIAAAIKPHLQAIEFSMPPAPVIEPVDLSPLQQGLSRIEEVFTRLQQTQLSELQGMRSELAAPLNTLLERIPDPNAVTEDEPEEPAPPAGIIELLPAFFKDGGRLADSTAPLISAATEGDAGARQLIASLIDWQAQSASRDAATAASLTHQLSRRILHYISARHGEDRDQLINAIQSWTKPFKTALEERFPNIKIIAVYPEDRFDTDRMEAQRSQSGGRLTVAMPLSWLIFERTENGERILHRAEVIAS